MNNFEIYKEVLYNESNKLVINIILFFALFEIYFQRLGLNPPNSPPMIYEIYLLYIKE